MYALAGYRAGELKVNIDRHEEYIQAKEQMDEEYKAVLSNELGGMKPTLSSCTEFDAKITCGESDFWVWRIAKLD